MKLSLTNVSVLAGAGGHASYDANGKLYSCGVNQYGDLGDGSTESSLALVPVAVQLPAGTTVTKVFASYVNGGALTSTGAYYDWGVNNNGQIGDGSTTSAGGPVQVSFPLRVIMATQGGSIQGNGQTIVMLSDHSLWAWGTDSAGQLGDGESSNELSPIQIHSPVGVSYDKISCGGWDCYAISTTGTVYSWGQNAWGQIGNGTARQGLVLTPTPVDSGATLISATANSVVVATP
jgi:alpha-tubulin suppressor-like RCC1 family protein